MWRGALFIRGQRWWQVSIAGSPGILFAAYFSSLNRLLFRILPFFCSWFSSSVQSCPVTRHCTLHTLRELWHTTMDNFPLTKISECWVHYILFCGNFTDHHQIIISSTSSRSVYKARTRIKVNFDHLFLLTNYLSYHKNYIVGIFFWIWIQLYNFYDIYLIFYWQKLVVNVFLKLCTCLVNKIEGNTKSSKSNTNYNMSLNHLAMTTNTSASLPLFHCKRIISGQAHFRHLLYLFRFVLGRVADTKIADLSLLSI
jgi:hypothetical protein